MARRSKKTTEQRVKGVLVKYLRVSESELTLNTTLEGDLGTDSLDQIELFMDFEEEFRVDIGNEEAKTIITIGDIVKLMETKI